MSSLDDPPAPGPGAAPGGEAGMIGRQIGRYVLEAVLGEGGMGLVYRAHDRLLGRRVALKVLRARDDRRGATAVTRGLLREARAAAALNHPNAVAIYDVGEDGGTAFIALELVVGHTLRGYVGAPMPKAAARLRWLVDVAEALAAAHREGIVHRDIKPENIMIREDGRVKVLDFGIARRFEAEREPASSSATRASLEDVPTLDSALVGTPQYMAPEQLRNEVLDGRADQFAWGVLAYELLWGRRPYQGRGARREWEPVLAPLAIADLPAGAVAVVLRALAVDRADRFASMDDLIAAIDGFADTRPRAGSIPSSAPLAGDVTTRVDAATEEGIVPTPDEPRIPGAAGPPRPATRRPLGLAVASLLVVAAFGFAFASGRRSATPAAPPAPRATSVIDLELPPMRSEAESAFRSGLACLRANGEIEDFERALSLDPSIGAAHLQIVVAATESAVDDAARAHFHAAEGLRSTMGARDQALLDALGPVILAQPSNWAETGQRLAAAVERFPGDAQLWYELGWFGSFGATLDGSNAALERAIALDPGYVLAFDALAQNHAYAGRLDEARALLDRCLSRSPSCTACRNTRLYLLTQDGACAASEDDARQMIAATPHQPLAYAELAGSLAGQGRSMATVREVLKQEWAATDDVNRPEIELHGEIRLATLVGDFESAERSARALASLVDASTREAQHGRAALALADTLDESGRLAEAGRVAADFLERRAAWEPDPRAEDFAMANDATPSLLAIARRAGTISEALFAAERAAWLRAWEAKAAPSQRGAIWMQGWARSSTTAEAATAALTALPRYAPIPPFRPRTLVDAAIGQTYLLAGRGDEAITWLTRATTMCRALAFPIAHTRAHLLLGQAREAAGDRSGACAAYAVVLSRWGHASPRSVTAAVARDRVLTLGCSSIEASAEDPRR